MKLMKTLILKKTISVISREGIHNFSPKTVAKEAGCSEALIYHHFKSKRDLIEACYAHISGGLHDSTSSAASEAGDLTQIWRALFSFLGEDRDTARFLLMYLLEMTDGLPDELGCLRDAVRQSQMEDGADSADLDAFSVQAARTMVLTACVYSIDRSGTGHSFKERYRELFLQVAEGFSDTETKRSSESE